MDPRAEPGEPGERGAAAPPAPTFSPLYRQIKALLLSRLQAGEWKPGEAIASELELAARLKVSQGTVRKAIDELAQENHLVRRQGKGTFVATHAEERTQYRFLRLTPDDERATGRLRRRLLECRRARAGAEVARALGLRSGDAVVQVGRLLLTAGEPEQPVVLDEIWLPGTLFKGLSAEKLASWRGPMYGLFEAEFDVRMVRAEERIRAVAAGAREARLLAVPEHAPLLLVERLSYTYGKRPVELRRGLYRTEQFHYRNELT
ncbi:MAG: GntR family transcriptional regulator [Rubrivivax sp.]|jgi:GntR family transcriptional regulator|nr:GntR family transcriptional regulator [Rubrivivax sp.]